MKNILVWVNTYNRPQRFATLIKDICEQNHHNISLMVFNDHSERPDIYDEIISEYNKHIDISYSYMDKNYGKHEYWKLYNFGLDKIRNQYSDIDYYFRLDDDLRLVGNDCFDKIIDIWECIDDPQKITLMPLHDKRVETHQWSNIQPIEMEFNNQKVMKIGWVDDIYFCTNKLYEVIDKIPTISKARWMERPKISTGTGQYITRIITKSYGLYGIHLDDCLITHEFDESKNPSVMNREYDDLC